MSKATIWLGEIGYGHALAGAALVTPVMSVFSPHGLTLVCVFAALAAGAVHIHRNRRFPAIGKWIGLPVASLMLYAWVSSIWAQRPWDTALVWPTIASVFLAGLVLVSAARSVQPEEWPRFRNACLLGFIAGLALLALEIYSEATITIFLRDITNTSSVPHLDVYRPAWFNRAATIMALMVWPVVMIALQEKRTWLALALPLAVPIVISQTASAAALAAVGLAILVFLLSMLWPRWMPRFAAVFLAAGVLFAPLIVRFALTLPAIHLVAGKDDAWKHRLQIWEYTAGLIAQKPVFGWGVDSSRYLNTRGEGPTAVMPLHPHNGALQIWLELGAVGAIIATVLAVAVCVAIDRVIVDRTQRAGALAALTSAVTIICLSYGIWQYWWLSGLWITAAVILLIATGAPNPTAAAHPASSPTVSKSQ